MQLFARNAGAGEPVDVASLGDAGLLELYELHLAGENRIHDSLVRAVANTTPVLAQPTMTDTVEDLGWMFALPEVRDFWKAWNVPRAPETTAARKAMLVSMAMGQTARHADAGRSALADGSRGLLDLMQAVETTCQERPDTLRTADGDLPSYGTLGSRSSATSCAAGCRCFRCRRAWI